MGLSGAMTATSAALMALVCIAVWLAMRVLE